MMIISSSRARGYFRMNFLVNNRKSFFVFLFCITSFCAQAEPENNPQLVQPALKSQEETIQEKLQENLLMQIEALLIHFQGLRISKLKIDKQQQQETTTTIEKMIEVLKAIKTQHGLHTTRKQLLVSSFGINSVIKALETSLKSGFITPLTISATDKERAQVITRSKKEPALQDIETFLKDNEKRLKNFNYLAANMHLNFFQKGYRAVSDAWNTPLYSFQTIGQNVYASSILKRLIVYPATLGCIVYGTNKELIKNIPFEGLRNKLLGFKAWLGQTESIQQEARMIKQYIVEKNPNYKKTSGWFGQTQEKEFVPAPAFAQLDKDGMLIPVPTEKVEYQGGPLLTVEETSTKVHPDISSPGVIGSISALMSWAAAPGWEAKFSLGIGAYLSRYVYEDAKQIAQYTPTLCQYIHKKLRGEEFDMYMKYQVPTETFDNVIGREEIKAKLQPIIDFISDPLHFVTRDTKIPCGFLLAGEPQTGKTHMVSALAGELDRALKKHGTVKGQEVKLFPIPISMLLKEGIEKIMTEARRFCAPCVLFFDEFDLTSAQRDGNKEFLASVLTTLSGMQTSSDLRELVVVMVATNRPENIDFAVNNPGRLDVTLYFEKPNFKDRKEFFEKKFKKKMVDTCAFDLDELARQTEACSYATLEAVLNETVREADKQRKLIGQDHVDKALDSVLRKMLFEGYDVSDENKKILAARYGAQAFASLMLKPTKKFVAATILRITEEIKEKHVLNQYYNMSNDPTLITGKGSSGGIAYGGIFRCHAKETLGLISHDELRKDCKIALASSVGQEILGLEYVNYAQEEMEAFNYAKQIIFKGVNENYFTKKQREDKTEKVWELIEECRQEVRDLLNEHKDNYEKIVELLQKREVIRASDIKECFKLDDLDLIDYYLGRDNKPTTD